MKLLLRFEDFFKIRNKYLRLVTIWGDTQAFVIKTTNLYQVVFSPKLRIRILNIT